MRKTQFDGDASLFLLRQPVRVIACQGLNQGTLAMINVARSCEDCVAWFHYFLMGNRLNS